MRPRLFAFLALLAISLTTAPVQAASGDGLLFSFGVGLTPVLTSVETSGSSQNASPERPDVHFRGTGGTVDLKFGWLALESPLLKNSPRLRDQLFVTLDATTRIAPLPAWSFSGSDAAGTDGFMRPYLLLDMATGPGATYHLHPHGVALSVMAGVGMIGLKSRESSVRTRFGPAFGFGVAKEWDLRPHWRSGIALRYGRIVAANPSRQGVDGEWTPRETYSSHLVSLQWTNSVTPPRAPHRTLPPPRP